MDREWLRYIRKMLCKDKCFMMEEKTQKEIAALIESALAEPTDDAVLDAVTKLMDWNRESTGGECDCEKCNALRLVCDAALRQYRKPTDDAVHPDDLDSATEDAVEWLEHMKSCHIDSWNKADDEDTAEPGAYEQYKATLKALDLAIQALRQMRQPTDTKILAALSWFEDMGNHEIVHRITQQPDYISTMPDTVIETIVTALRQMGSTNVSTDSTRVTDKCEWCDKILTLFTHSGKFIPENQPPRNYCPACGRKLVK